MYEEAGTAGRTTTGQRSIDQVGWSLAALLAAAFIVAFAAVAAARAGYTYELEWLEYGVLGHVERVLDGGSLYVAPSEEFVPFLYPPLYYYAAAAVSAVLGDGLFSLRVISIAATLLTMLLLYRVVARETNRRLTGVLAAGLYAACYPLTGTWYDLARVDALSVALLLAGAYLLRFAKLDRTFLLAGAVMAAAALTKQTALVIAVPLGLYLLLTHRRRGGALYLAGLALPFAAVTVALNMATTGWYRFWVFDLGNQHDRESSAYRRFFEEDLAPLGIAIAICLVGALLMLRSRRRWSAGFWIVGIVAAAAASLSSRVHTGGFINVLMPVYLFAAVGFGIAVAETMRLRVSWARLALAAVVVQFAVLAYDPRPAVPTANDERSGARFVEWLRQFDGDVLVMSHPHYAVLAGKLSHAGQGSVIDVLRATDEDAKEQLRASYRRGVYEQRYAAIVIDSPSDLFVLPDDLARYYKAAPVDIYERPDDLLPVSSLRTRPSIVYTPIDR